MLASFFILFLGSLGKACNTFATFALPIPSEPYSNSLNCGKRTRNRERWRVCWQSEQLLSVLRTFESALSKAAATRTVANQKNIQPWVRWKVKHPSRSKVFLLYAKVEAFWGYEYLSREVARRCYCTAWLALLGWDQECFAFAMLMLSWKVTERVTGWNMLTTSETGSDGMDHFLRDGDNSILSSPVTCLRYYGVVIDRMRRWKLLEKGSNHAMSYQFLGWI